MNNWQKLSSIGLATLAITTMSYTAWADDPNNTYPPYRNHAQGNPNQTLCRAKGSPGTNSIDVRNSPGSSNNIGGIFNGTQVAIQHYSPDRNWAFVSSQNTAGYPVQGWVYVPYLDCNNRPSVGGSMNRACQIQAPPGNRFVLARSAPNSTQTTARFVNGNWVNVQNWSPDGKWSSVFAPNSGKQGWVWSAYLRCDR
jgi:hypothetical protein